MSMHEQFVELCALAPLGELSGRQQRELDEHLLVCASCRNTASELQGLLAEVPAALHERAIREQEANGIRRFWQRAQEEGVSFSSEIDARWNQHSSTTTTRSSFRRFLPHIAGAAVAASLLVGAWAGYSQLLRFQPANPTAVTFPIDSPSVPMLQIGPDTSDLEAEVATLQKQLQQRDSERFALEAKLARAVDQTGEEKATREAAQAQLAAALQNLSAANEAAAKNRADRDSMAANFVAQQATITELNEKIANQAAMSEQDRHLAAAARDIRGLMGERNLHIIDVFDVATNGQSKKTFGRVFYTEGKSLIFYAFDLQAKGRAHNRAFQAWGQHSQQPAASLGAFTLDDPAQNRWILKVEDAKLLSNIDVIFVTMEQPGAQQPKGDRLLYAYLKNPINHP